LNKISHDTAMDLIRSAINDGYSIKEVFVDTVGDPRKYTDKLKKEFPGIEFTVASKADSKFPVVSAASIVAKVRLIKVS
jgi:ribonuclease H2 subunit A